MFDPRHRLLQPLEAAGIAARDDHEILVGFVPLAAGKFDLVGEILSRDHVRHVFVVMRTLGIELILDMDPSNPGMNEFLDRAHRVQRLAETRTGIGDNGDFHRFGNIAGRPHLLVHRQQRFGSAARAAGHKAAIVDGLEPDTLDQPAAERIIGDRHVNKAFSGQ